jgi:hypothetical protein
MTDDFATKEFLANGKLVRRTNGKWRFSFEIKDLRSRYPFVKCSTLRKAMRDWLDSKNVRYVYGFGHVIFEKNEDATVFALKYSSEISLLHTTN